jgi:hypothetical protein
MAADKSISSDGPAGIVDVNVDDPVQHYRRAGGGHAETGNSYGGSGAVVVLPDNHRIGG